jgi:hypothetical protein
MILVSAVFFGYYQLFLRNRAFHTYNRWYLLASVLLSLLLPLVHPSLQFPWVNAGRSGGVIYTLIWADNAPGKAGAPTGSQGLFNTFSGTRLLIGAYGLIALLLLTRLIRSVYRIVRRARKYHSTCVGSIRLLKTNEAGTPFSFLRWLFWNEHIDLNEGPGQLIFLHESYHIRQRHTLDILGLETVCCLCWFNPFFHWTRRELKLLHEFGADEYALSCVRHKVQRYDYAEFLVWQSMGRSLSPAISHSFFHKQLKRRITMITQNSLKPSGPLGRLMALPLFVLLLGIFASAPAQDIAASKDAPSSADSRLLTRNYMKNLRYPDEVVNADQGGVIWFSVTLGKGGKVEQFQTLDAPPQGQDVMKISVKHVPGPHASPMPQEEVTKMLQAEARRASETLSSTASGKHPSVAPGKYYFEITFRIEHKEHK